MKHLKHLKQPTPRGLEDAETKGMEKNYWKRRVLEPLYIHQQQHTSNLNFGLAIDPWCYCCLTILHALDNIHYLFTPLI